MSFSNIIPAWLLIPEDNNKKKKGTNMSNENEASVQEDTLGLAMAAALVEPQTEGEALAAQTEGDVVIQTDEQMNP